MSIPGQSPRRRQPQAAKNNQAKRAITHPAATSAEQPNPSARPGRQAFPARPTTNATTAHIFGVPWATDAAREPP